VSARRALRRHADEPGAPLAVHHHRPGVWTKLALLVFWLLMPLSVLVNPGPNPVLNVSFPVVMAVLVLGLYALIRGERLAVCECGVLRLPRPPAGRKFHTLADGAAWAVPQQLNGAVQRSPQALPGFTRGIRV